ncbi:MAG: copper resistance protein CopB [Robiginitomaculum sp.]|nr:MAG: copper resistance protein CopB [Robiginitomaculum sp.]
MLANFFQVDRAEFVLGQGNTRYLWDTQGWIGTDYQKLWVKFEGEGDFNSRLEGAELQGLYSRMIAPFFDFQAGIRQDVGPDIKPTTYAVVGIQGLAPQWFEVDSAIFLSEDGDFTARIEAEYEVFFTQRLIGQPRAEVNFAAQDVQALGIGAGLSTVELGFRLRYEIKREFAPYIGVAWQSAVGDTADFRRLAGEHASSTSFVAGIRLWF